MTSKHGINKLLKITNSILTHGSLPYTELEYIQSSGTQYIDTGLAPTNYIKTIIDFEKTGDVIDYERLLGVKTGSSIYDIMRDNRKNAFTCRLNGQDRVSFTVLADTKYHLEFTDTYLKLDDVTKATFSTGSFTASTNLEIFHSYDRYGIFKLYSMQIYNSNELVRDFIPVKRRLDDTICLYDKITDTFFTNQGTGEFIAGPEI